MMIRIACCLMAVLFVCSCATPNIISPLPDKTPFDSKAELRSVYLEAYEFGYAQGINGKKGKVPIDMAKPGQEGALAQGFAMGQNAGLEAAGK